MPIGLFIDATLYSPFAPDIAESHVLVYLDEAKKQGEINIWINPELKGHQITSVLGAIRRFLTGEQFRSIDFEQRRMMVRHRGHDDDITSVPADEGSLCEDSIVEFLYELPHK